MVVEVKIGDFEYDIEVTYFDPGQEPDDWDPGVGAEIELGDEVDVWSLDGKGRASKTSTISLERLIEIYAEAEEIRGRTDKETSDLARRRLEEHCIEDVIKQIQDGYDDLDV
jgi:hypothetical protein